MAWPQTHWEAVMAKKKPFQRLIGRNESAATRNSFLDTQMRSSVCHTNRGAHLNAEIDVSRWKYKSLYQSNTLHAHWRTIRIGGCRGPMTTTILWSVGYRVLATKILNGYFYFISLLLPVPVPHICVVELVACSEVWYGYKLLITTASLSLDCE